MTEQLHLFADDEPAPVRRRGEFEVPPTGKLANCQSCGMAIIWAETTNGHPIPLSAATIEHRDDKRYALAHFADCPQGKDWSKR